MGTQGSHLDNVWGQRADAEHRSGNRLFLVHFGVNMLILSFEENTTTITPTRFGYNTLKNVETRLLIAYWCKVNLIQGQTPVASLIDHDPGVVASLETMLQPRAAARLLEMVGAPRCQIQSGKTTFFVFRRLIFSVCFLFGSGSSKATVEAVWAWVLHLAARSSSQRLVATNIMLQNA